MSIPNYCKAVIIGDEKPLVDPSFPTPKPGSGDLLIKVKAVGANPTDWKHIVYKNGPKGGIIGNDFAGEIVQVGTNVDQSAFKVGDTICGMIHGSSRKFPNNGAFSQYCVADPKLTVRLSLETSKADFLPEGRTKTFEGAAALPLSLLTAAECLYYHLGAQMEWKSPSPQNPFSILIWGGATSFGQLLIQLARISHVYTKIVTVASKRNEDLLRKYGADDVFDYHDDNVVQQIKAKYPDIQHLVDGVSEASGRTFRQVYEVAGREKPTELVQLTNFSKVDSMPEEERKKNVRVSNLLVYLATGHEIIYRQVTFPANPGYRKTAVDFMKFVASKIANGDIRHNKVKVYRRGLDSIPEILDDLRSGKVSAEKLVASC